MHQTSSRTSIGNTQEPQDTSGQQNFFPSISNPPSCRDVTILKGGWMSEDTTVHLPLLPPPPTVPDTSLHTNGQTTANYWKPDRSPTYVSDLRVRPTCLTYVRSTWPAYVSTLRVQLSDHFIILIIYLR